MSLLDELEYIPIKVATPEKILEWSYGEIKKPKNIRYCKHYKPEEAGLFCERIFKEQE